jgi:hypothetical protein
MEFADSLIAILRAQGIPARAAYGYGNDPTENENKITNSEAFLQKVGHQWVQVWIPDYGWLSVDPTWGQSSRTYIGSDLDHILWYTTANSNDKIADILVFTADSYNSGDVKNFNLYLKAMPESEFPNPETLKNLTELTESYANVTDNPVLFWVKTTLVGRFVALSIPVFASIVILITLISIIIASIKKILGKKKVVDTETITTPVNEVEKSIEDTTAISTKKTVKSDLPDTPKGIKP